MTWYEQEQKWACFPFSVWFRVETGNFYELLIENWSFSHLPSENRDGIFVTWYEQEQKWIVFFPFLTFFLYIINSIRTSVGIFPGTFLIFKSRDFWTSLVPGQGDHGTFNVSRSCPVLPWDLGPLVPGLPGTSWDLFGRLFEKKKSIQRYMFFYFCKFFFFAKLLIFEP